MKGRSGCFDVGTKRIQILTASPQEFGSTKPAGGSGHHYQFQIMQPSLDDCDAVIFVCGEAVELVVPIDAVKDAAEFFTRHGKGFNVVLGHSDDWSGVYHRGRHADWSVFRSPSGYNRLTSAALAAPTSTRSAKEPRRRDQRENEDRGERQPNDGGPIDAEHALIRNVLRDWCKESGYGTADDVHRDLVICANGKELVVEVKSSSRLQDMYTAIGQLLVWGEDGLRLIYSPAIAHPRTRSTIERLGIDILDSAVPKEKAIEVINEIFARPG